MDIKVKFYGELLIEWSNKNLEGLILSPWNDISLIKINCFVYIIHIFTIFRENKQKNLTEKKRKEEKMSIDK